MSRIKEIMQAFDDVRLLEHPFYREWSEGRLPVEKLSRYAVEYGRFVHLIHKGWETLDEPELDEEEHEHAEMWDQFTKALPASDVKPSAQNNALVAAAEALFADGPEAIGALYAFEHQQPETATSKLLGLKEHYGLPASAEVYFQVHAANQGEAGLLEEKINAMPEVEYRRAVGACRLMATALWAALDGVYYN